MCAKAGSAVQTDGFTGEPVGFQPTYVTRLVAAIQAAYAEPGAQPFAVHGLVMKTWLGVMEPKDPPDSVVAAALKGGW